MTKTQAFARLDANFADDPQPFLDTAYSIASTLVGEFLIDACDVDEDDAFEWAFEWAVRVEATL